MKELLKVLKSAYEIEDKQTRDVFIKKVCYNDNSIIADLIELQKEDIKNLNARYNSPFFPIIMTVGMALLNVVIVVMLGWAGIVNYGTTISVIIVLMFVFLCFGTASYILRRNLKKYQDDKMEVLDTLLSIKRELGV